MFEQEPGDAYSSSDAPEVKDWGPATLRSEWYSGISSSNRLDVRAPRLPARTPRVLGAGNGSCTPVQSMMQINLKMRFETLDAPVSQNYLMYEIQTQSEAY